MAAAANPDEVLTSTREKANFQRLARLLISGGTSLMREIFDQLCLPSNLPTILKNPAVEKNLKAAKLTKPQWDCLYPSPGVYGKSADFDVTLLLRLLKTICSITPPVTGWNALPKTTDHSLAAEIVRIKHYRNSVYGHVSQSMEITNDMFSKLWKDIREALLGIAGQISPTKKTAWQDAIDNFLKDPLTAEDERNVQELLRWYRKDIEVKECIETSAHKMREGMESLEISVREKAQEIKDQFGGELKTTSQEVQSLVREEARDIKDQLGGELKTTSQDIKDQLGGELKTTSQEFKDQFREELKTTSHDVQSLLREEAQGIKDKLGEMHQSIDRLSSSADCRQEAQLRLRIDCEAVSWPGPRTGSSEMLATAQEPQANVTAMPVTSFQQQVSIPASSGKVIVPQTNLPDTQGVLNLIMLRYLENVNPATQEEFNGFLSYMTDLRQVAVVDIKPGSLIITVECNSLEILEELWEDYRTGHLNDMAQKYLVTEDILEELGLIEVRLMTTILEDDYRACREYFLQKPEDSLCYSPRSSYVAVVAIDFGTTYSGFAFSFIKDHGKDSIFMNRDWANEQGGRTSKTPTCLLLNSDLSFDSFGYEAVETYAGLQDECHEGEYLFFQHFKMDLHNDKTINIETTIKAANGRHVKAKTVFAHSIRFLKEEAIQVICQRTGDEYFSGNDIQWVVTVPAIWTPRAKQFMREAAYEAGLGSPDNPEQVMIALEPEAAAICCLEKNMSEFQSETGSSSVEGLLSQPNTHYMIVDIGGGTLDVTVHAIRDDGNIKEIHKVTGGPYGGIKVNQQFEALLNELLDSRKLQIYRKQSPSDWLCLMNEFEGKKKGERILDSKVMTNIRLPRSFVSLANQCWRSRYGEKDVKLKNNEYLALSSEVMKKLFFPVIENIKKHLRSLQRNQQLSKVKTMLLVGGFSDSALLQKEIKSEFSRKFRVLIPNHAAIAVVQGAVMFGKKPSKITERVMRTTYGAGCSRDFVQGVHREEKKFVVDGIEMCNNLFSLFVRENDTVRTGQKITRNYSPLRATKNNITYFFYATSNPDAEYITDPGMTEIGSVTVQSPDTWRGKDRTIEVSMYFGRTEITATAKDVSSGNVARTILDFLHV